MDIHCVTRWSKLGTPWQGVALDTLLADVDTSAFALAHSYGGYTTNLPLDDLVDGQAWVAFGFGGEPLEAEHGGPARLLVPHLYFWKSAKWLQGITLSDHDEPGFWESLAITTTGTRGASSGTGATDLAGGHVAAPRRDRHRAHDRA